MTRAWNRLGKEKQVPETGFGPGSRGIGRAGNFRRLAGWLVMLVAIHGEPIRVDARPPASDAPQSDAPQSDAPQSDAPQSDSAVPLVVFPLTDPAHVARWARQHDVGEVVASGEGMRIEITGADPYLTSPRQNFPPGEPLQIRLRLRSETGGTGQIFYFSDGPREAHSVRFGVPAKVWHDVNLPVPPLGPGYRFRLDPPGGEGTCVVRSLMVERPLQVVPPTAATPTPFMPQPTDVLLRSGGLTLRHQVDRWHSFSLDWRGKVLAVAHNQPRISYFLGRRQRWTQPGPALVTSAGNQVVVESRWRDEDGAEWRVRQQFEPSRENSLRAVTTVSVDQARRVAHLPALVLMAGLGTHGTRKGQGLLAGVEYLEDEPSSSTADLEGPAALRRVPAPHKLTFPLMVIQHADSYLAVRWRRHDDVAPLFDSPDRVWGTEAHVLGLIAPGASPRHRHDGNVVVHEPWEVSPDRPLALEAEIWVGEGTNVTRAISEYVARVGLPDVPEKPSIESYAALASAGWLDTPLRDGDRFRHAVGNNFQAQPALDAAWMLEWLADVAPDMNRAARLRESAAAAAATVPEASTFHSHVGHLQLPVAGLVLRDYPQTQQQALDMAAGLSRRFREDGLVHYTPPAQGIDFSRTHSARHASGLTALPLVRMLQAVAYGGDERLRDEALRRMEALTHYDGTVPRGAQTWEIPLHTPDILAAAHLVKACVLAYRWTGDERWRDRALYWAWTGVPFVYLDRPTPGTVGPYATIAVLGATQWEAPVWIGLPVQWCGLVYAESLRWLAPHDPEGPWNQLADGIVGSAIQQCYPMGHPHQGLLPDSFDLVAQVRNPADINPGTLQPLALEWLTGQVAFDMGAWRERRQWLCAPGRVSRLDARDDRLSAVVNVWHSRGGTVVVHGLGTNPEVWSDGAVVPAERTQFLPATGSLTIRLPRAGEFRLEFRKVTPRDATR